MLRSITALRLTSSFYCHAAQQALHSFPTRRSSDLGAEWLLRPWVLVLMALTIAGAVYSLWKARRNGESAARGPGVGNGESELDRKSTRLNSSHSQISYAVFCLKKKNARLRYA